MNSPALATCSRVSCPQTEQNWLQILAPQLMQWAVSGVGAVLVISAPNFNRAILPVSQRNDIPYRATRLMAKR
jgi:hypothetical protein